MIEDIKNIRSGKRELRRFGMVMAVALALWGSVVFLWMSFSIIIGWFMTRLIMIVLFFIILTPVSIVARLLGKHFLDIEFGKSGKESYWIRRPDQSLDPCRYENQF